MSFIAMKVFGVDANIMSLAGIAIAIGTMVDMGIIILENIYGGLADWEAAGSPGGAERRLEVIRESAAEVVPAVITAVSTTIVSFLARVLPDRPRPSTVLAAGLDQDICAGIEPDRGGDRRADALPHLLEDVAYAAVVQCWRRRWASLL